MELLTYAPFRVFASILLFFFGASLGSFASCMAFRFAKGEEKNKRSYCSACGHELRAIDLIPIFSFLFLKGRCRYCGENIGIKELINELLCGIFLCSGYLYFGFCIEFYVLLVMVTALSFASIYDLYTMRIPDFVHVVIVVAWIALFVVCDNKSNMIINSLISGLGIPLVIIGISFVIKKTKGKESIGFGDIKLIAVTGLILGFYRGVLNLLIMSILGLAYVAIMRKKKGEKFPFAPCISVSTVFCYMWGNTLIDAYMRLLL